MALCENWAQLVVFQQHPKNKIVLHEPGGMVRDIPNCESTPTGFQHTQARAPPKFSGANR
jgi:hypothetical protein